MPGIVVKMKEYLRLESSVQTNCHDDDPKKGNDSDETLHETLPTREGGDGGEESKGEGRHGCSDGVPT